MAADWWISPLLPHDWLFVCGDAGATFPPKEILSSVRSKVSAIICGFRTNNEPLILDFGQL